MSFGLSDTTIEKITAVLLANKKVKAITVYGSRAKENYRNGSDIDLTLTGDDLLMDDLLRFDTKLDDLLLPYKIDLSAKHLLHSPDLLEHIERVGQPFEVSSSVKSN